MKHIIAIVALIAANAAHADLGAFAPSAVGVHLATLHAQDPAPGKPDWNNVNPGLYLRWENGATVGGYYNSERKFSAYAGWTFETAEWHRMRAAVTLGAITGYSNGVLPLVAPSASLRLTDHASARVTFAPKVKEGGSACLHLSVEYKF